MRCGVVVLLICALVIHDHGIAVQGEADGLRSVVQNKTNATNSKEKKLVQPDASTLNNENGINKDEGVKETTKNNEEINSKGSLERRDEPIRETEAKENVKNVSTSVQKDSTAQSGQDMESVQDSHVEECDPTHRCIIGKKLVACLRVPGEDSLAVSLLLDNRGKNLLDVEIIAPDFVNLDQPTVQLRAKEHKEVRVSISDGANDTTILLKADGGYCSLNLRNTAAKGTSRVSSYINMRMLVTSVLLLVMVFGILGIVGLCIKFRRLHHQEGGSMYQKLDTELPISVGGKKGLESDQWDSSWGDDWGDEEAPLTPSKPVSKPALKGLASRRSTKDGWKD